MTRFILFVLLILAVAAAAVASQTAGREIPLSDIVSTVRQEGLQYIGSGRRQVAGKVVEEDYASAMEEIMRSRGGASNAFLVDASTIGDAVKATARIVAGYRSADNPVPFSNVSGSNWLVVYLGCGHSQPTKWVVDRLTVDGNTVRLIYRKPQAKFQTTDVVFYYYWIPVGGLDNGTYDLRLYDADLKVVTLMRRVEVKRH